MSRTAGTVLTLAALCGWLSPPCGAQQVSVEKVQEPSAAAFEGVEGSRRAALEATIAEWNRREAVDFDAAATKLLVNKALAVEGEWIDSGRADREAIRLASPLAFDQYLSLLAAVNTPQETGKVPKLESLLAEELGRGGAFVQERNPCAYLAVVVDPSHCGSTTVIDDQPLEPMECDDEKPRRRKIVTTPGKHVVVVERAGQADCQRRISVPVNREREVECSFPK